MSSSVRAKQEELVASLNKFETNLKTDLGLKLVDIENSIDNLQEELKSARAKQSALKSELLTYKGQFTDLEKFIAEEDKRPKVCPSCNYPLQNLFKCCPMCGTPIPQAGDPDVDYLIPAGAVKDNTPKNNAGPAVPPPPPVPAGVAGHNLPPTAAAAKGPNIPAPGQVPPPPGAAPQKYFPSFERDSDRGDAGQDKKEEVDNAAGFLSRFGFGKQGGTNNAKSNSGTAPGQPIELPPNPNMGASSGPAVPPPPPAGAQPAKYFPSFERESDRGNKPAAGPVPPKPPVPPVPPKGAVPPVPPAGPVPPVPPKGPIPPVPPKGPIPPVPPIGPIGDVVMPNSSNVLPPKGPKAPVSVAPTGPIQLVVPEVTSNIISHGASKAPGSNLPNNPVEAVEVVNEKDIVVEGEAKDVTEKVEEKLPPKPPTKLDLDMGDLKESPIPTSDDEMKALYEYHECAEGIVIDRYIGTGYAKVIVPGGLSGKTVVAVAARAFLKNSEIVSIEMQNGIKLIGSEAFFGCSALKSVSLPDSVDKIKSAAFMDCSELVNIAMPSQMTDIGAFAFANCKSLSSIVFPEGIKWISEQTCIKCSSLKAITFPEGLRSVENAAFQECTSLEGFTLPNTTVSIGDKAFYNCRGLNNVIIPPSVTRIGTRVFFPKMGQNMIPKLTVFCSNGSAVYTFCKNNSIKSKADPDMPATAPIVKNKSYAVELAYWLKDKDDISIKELKEQTVKALELTEYEVDDFFVEEDGNCKESHAIIPMNMAIEEAEAILEKLPQSCYVQIIHAYDGRIDEAAKNSQSPF